MWVKLVNVGVEFHRRHRFTLEGRLRSGQSASRCRQRYGELSRRARWCLSLPLVPPHVPLAAHGGSGRAGPMVPTLDPVTE